MEAKSKKPKESKERNGLSKAVKTIITIGSVAVVISAFALYNRNEGRKQGDLDSYKKGQLEVTFDNSKQKHDVIDLLDIEFHPLKLSKTQDSLSVKLDRVDTLLVATYNQKQRDARLKKTQDSIENDRAIDLQLNREKKYKLQAEMLDELILVKVELRNINQRLDTIQ